MTIGSHQTPIGKEQARFTPRWILEPLGPFQTDVCAGDPRPWDIGTEHNITAAQNCLTMDWRAFGRTWCNPPFLRYAVGDFVRKMIEHNRGILLLHVRPETGWFRPIFRAATSLLFLNQRVVFCNADGTPATIEDPQAKHFGKKANSGAPVVLASFGFEEADVLSTFDDGGAEEWPKEKLGGAFTPLAFPRGILVMAIEQSWRELVSHWLETSRGPVRVGDLYRFIEGHPKARRNPNWRAKVRQTLQRGAGRRVAQDQWVAA